MTGFAWTPPPPLTAEWPRQRITSAILQGLDKPVCVVVAPAGYGKTVAARSVFDGFDGRRGWWTVTPNDQDFELALPRLTAAARTAWALPERQSAGFAGFLADLAQAGGGLLVVDDTQLATPAVWGALGQIISMAPHSCRILLLCRTTPPLPVMLWHSQGRLNLFDQSLLALTPEEWAHAGFDGGEEACRDACGWWSAERAARSHAAGGWNTALAAWLDEAWFAPLPPRHQYLLGLASLLPELSDEDISAVAGQAKNTSAALIAEIAALPGPLQREDGVLRLAPRYRPYIAQIWRRRQPQDWAAATRNGVQILLARGACRRAAELAYETGLPELQLKVLEAAGWTLLFGRHRALLQTLLEAVEVLPDPPPAAQLLRFLWQVDVLKTPHKAEPKLRALLPGLDGPLRSQALAISAAMGWNYDDFGRARDEARQALESAVDDDHPSYHYALLALGNALAGLGELHEAEQHLRRVMAYARRDELAYLQLEAQHRRAHLAADAGRPDEALALAEDARALAEQLGLPLAGVLDSTGRLLAWIHLQRLETAPARQALDAGAPAAAAYGEYWNFPYRLCRAWLALAEHAPAAADADVHWLTQRLAEQFYCLKWKNETALAQLWHAAVRLDKDRLGALEGELAACDWPASLHRDRRRILLAAARLLLGRDEDAAELEGLQRDLESRGALTAALQLQLVRALLARPFDRTLLLDHVRSTARRGLAFDYLWLAGRAVAPLEQLLGAPELIHEPATLGFLRGVVQRLLQPAPQEAEAADDVPPKGLTDKEWQILRLIGQQFTNEQIAARLFVSLATVKTHINHLYSKLDIRNRTEAVRRARELSAGR